MLSNSSSEFNETKTKAAVAYWYFGCAALVFGIVILGGVTRLTESGLSIVEWNLISGMKPPTSEEEWNAEFAKYQDFPEYKLLNKGMTLSEFKRIFYFEWAHRNLGRFIGIAFVLPGLYFARKGWMSATIMKRSLIVGSLIGFQGLLGWLMVKSGLKDEIIQNNEVPRVNHFWLSAHLSSAFVIYSTMIMTGMEILAKLSGSNSSKILLERSNSRFRMLSIFIAGMVFLTSISGAWVAGLDAGLIYNEFPYMGENLVPSDMWALSADGKIPWYMNLLKNPSAVQFDHRVMAISTFTMISIMWALSLRRKNIPKISKLAAHAVLGTACVQVALGITTLLSFVPVPLAAAHQGGSLTLLSVALWLLHTLRYIPK